MNTNEFNLLIINRLKIIYMKNLKEIKIDFNSLIHSIPNYLNELKKEVNLNNFIFDKDEIEKIEIWFKDKIKFKEKDLNLFEIYKKLFFSYCSSAFIKSNGGEIILDIKKNSFTYGEPIIINYGAEGYPWVAISIYGWIEIIETRGLKKSLSETIIRNLKDKTE